jgi:hypothetical protein
MQTTDQTTEGVAPESQRDSQQRLAMPREQEPPVDRTKDAVRSGVGGVPRPCRRFRLTVDLQADSMEELLDSLAELRDEIALDPDDKGGLLCSPRSSRHHVMWEDKTMTPQRYMQALHDHLNQTKGGGGAEQEADNGTRETKSAAQGHSDQALRTGAGGQTP